LQLATTASGCNTTLCQPEGRSTAKSFISSLSVSPLSCSFYGPEPTGSNTATISWQRWLCTSGQRDHSSSRATASLVTLVSHFGPSQNSLARDVPCRQRFGREHRLLFAGPATQLPSKSRHLHLEQQRFQAQNSLLIVEVFARSDDYRLGRQLSRHLVGKGDCDQSKSTSKLCTNPCKQDTS
jgi:hypothetical protein